ncbi:MAG: hypothetical protein Q8O67_22680 [Deltaproteobacteria bacterium]|nr:hypothetical protein [Deltaproteobacteria bacterium]
MRFPLLLVGLCASAAAAEPCRPPSQLVPEIAFPADGDVVPTNGSILMHDTDALLELAGAVSGPIELHTERIEVDDGFGPVFYRRVVADLGLPAGDTVQFRVDGAFVLTVAVDTTADDEAPAIPALTFEGPYSDGNCVPYASIGAEGEAGAVLIAARDGAPRFEDGVRLAGLAVSSSVIVSGPDATSATIRVAAVDRAGNVSDDAEVHVEFPDRRGCPCVPTAPGILLPLLWMRGRKRSRHVRAPAH